ncbi:hypothetical protein ACFY93_01160 [Streptomyces sp. NPDC008313]|uniref:hypothetical protein n=1 Tax=Streptomyces sp. NPDC008313 TaxID=3364826 RepID=UPI0036F081B8
MHENDRDVAADVVETPLDQLLEAVANRLEEQTSEMLGSLRQQAARLREETSASVNALREQAARLREEQDFQDLPRDNGGR